MRQTWQRKKLADLIQPLTTIDPRKEPSKSFTYIDVSSVSRKTCEIVTTSWVKGSDAPSRARRLVKAGDVIVATIRPTLQRIAEVPIELDEAVCSTGYFVLRPKSGVLSRFLFYSLFTREFSDAMARLQRGASYPAVSDGDVKSQRIVIPPLPEQKRIVAILDEAFAGIATAVANTEKNLANARELFESYLNAVFSQHGEGWVQERLEDICTFSSGGTPSKKNSSYWSGEIPWISGRDMKATQLSDSLLHITKLAVDESATRMAPVGSLLILVRGMGLAHGAQIAELLVLSAFNQDIKGIHPAADLVPRYLVFALRHRINANENVLSNAAHGTLKIDMERLRDVMISFPPYERQKILVEQIDALIDETQHLESIYQQKLTALDELKQSLLKKAFSGELTAGKVDANATLKEEEVA